MAFKKKEPSPKRRVAAAVIGGLMRSIPGRPLRPFALRPDPPPRPERHPARRRRAPHRQQDRSHPLFRPGRRLGRHRLRRHGGGDRRYQGRQPLLRPLRRRRAVLSGLAALVVYLTPLAPARRRRPGGPDAR
ncbi:MAG: hypothetical protein MZV63_65190 [Marinilabiliales bacterium]|nr:hypothetical protein [Marinilabiliales bacterium]